jgi:hypothetical protein
MSGQSGARPKLTHVERLRRLMDETGLDAAVVPWG